MKGDSGKIWGAAIKNTNGSINPLIISIGNKISLDKAIECVLKFSYYRVVEPVRYADKVSRFYID